jgi:hypothetical protein
VKYVIEGAARETGEDVSISVEASDYREAEHKANALGILVSTINEDHSEMPVVVERPVPAAAP